MPIKIRKAEVQDFKEVYLLIKEFANFIKTPEKLTISAEQMTEDRNLFSCLVA